MANDTRSSRMIGRTIGGRYQIVELLGRGGMAEVYKAYQSALDRHVAIKLMHTFLAEDPTFIQRFEREAKNVAALNHRNIIQVYDFAHDGDASYMVMEYVDGEALKEHVEGLQAKNEWLPLDRAIEIIKSVGLALDYAHKKNMIHRDIKPANIMLSSDGRVILTDFGIAKLLTGPQFTATGALVGTPAYMAPEQGLGQPGDARTDIYALGVVLFQLATGELPYRSDTPMAVVFKHINDPLPLPRTIKPDLPEGIEKVILKALAKDPEERYQSAREMVDHLRDLRKAAELTIPTSTLTGLKTATLPAPGHSTVARAAPTIAAGQPAAGDAPKSKRNTVLAAIGAGIVFLFLAVAGLSAMGILGNNNGSATEPAPTGVAGVVLPTVPTTPTEDSVATAFAAQEATIIALQATSTPTATPDVAATRAGCTFDYALVEQTPANGSQLLLGDPIDITIELANSGTCTWDSDTRLQWISGAQDAEAGEEMALGALEPGREMIVSLQLEGGENAGVVNSVWRLHSPSNSLEIGELLRFDFEIVPPTATPTATATATATPAPVTRVPATPLPTSTPLPLPTAAVTAPPVLGAGGVSLSFFSCDYDGTDYTCLTNVNFSGGSAPWNVIISGGGDGMFTWFESDSRFWTMRSRRCESVTGTITITDGAGAQATGSFFFDPRVNLLFPPSSTNFCSGG